jgi:isoleucyl-tRNA synthetase
MAVAFHPELEYALAEVSHPAWEKPRRLIMARGRLEAVLKEIGASGHKILELWRGKDIAPGHPQDRRRASFIYETPLGGREGIGVLAEYVSAEDGTGVVHTAPGHGADDFHTGQKYGLDILCPVNSEGRFTEEVQEFEGRQVFEDGNPAVLEALKNKGRILAESTIEHSYPHCWRCKNPVIFRATEQWFLNVNFKGLRDRLLESINRVSWIPEVGRSRISSMVELRPDWCLSRQRVWGTPIPILYCASCHSPLQEEKALSAIEEKIAREGDSFWFDDWGQNVSHESWDFLPPEVLCPRCQGTKFRRETDILDVWMDSGASWLAVLKEGQLPCDLYLEGSDQHRGWFQSSLVVSVALRDQAPYRKVLTHGFVLDQHGRAMHKSAGNVVSPQEVIQKVGADVLRLWVALCDYHEDVRLSDKLLEGPAESYRKLRNTLRYLLGNTSDFGPQDRVDFQDLPELERFVLHRLSLVHKRVLADFENYQFRQAARALIDFCAAELSAFYLDILKDRLYTFPQNHPARRAAQTVMSECLERLLILVSPILSFTAEEAWQSWSGKTAPSVFLAELRASDPCWMDLALAQRWEKIFEVRGQVQKALEEARAAGKIGSSLQARVILKGGGKVLAGPQPAWPEILLVSQAQVIEGDGELSIEVFTAEGSKCPRCWRYQTDIGLLKAHPGLCGRCAKFLSA